MKNVALAIAVAGLVAACSSQEVKKDVPVADKSTPPPPMASASTSSTSPTTNPRIIVVSQP